MIIEWNAHMFSSDTVRFPFHPQATYVPPADNRQDDPLASYMVHLAEMGIDKAVLVQPEPYGDNHALVLRCLKREPERFWGTSLFYPKDSNAPQQLRDLVAVEPKIVATRFHAHRGKSAYLDSFDDQGVRALWETAAALRLVVELHIGPDYGKQVTALIRAHPATPVLIDHCAEPHMGNAVEFADILALARFDNVYMKLSGLSHFSADGPLYLETKPFTCWLADAFGANRLVWSSGSPEIIDAHFRQFSEVERDCIKGGNLEHLLNR